MSVLLGWVDGRAAPAGSSEHECLRGAVDMVLDLLRCQGTSATQVTSDTLVTKPVDVEEAVATFYRLQAMLRGLACCPPGDNLRFVLVVAHERDRDERWSRPKTELLLRESSPGQGRCDVLLFSPSVYEEARTRPELGLRKVAPETVDLRRMEQPGNWYKLVPASATDRSGALNPPPPPRPSPGERGIGVNDACDRAALWLLAHLDPRLVLGGTAAALVAIAVALFGTLHHPGQNHGVPTSVHAPDTLQPATHPHPAVHSAVAPAPAPPPIRAATGAPIPSPLSAKPASAGEAPKPETSAPARRESHEVEDATLRARHSGNKYTAAELRSLVAKADRLAGNGDYDRAIEFYEIVLRNDPKDAEARRGLARARENKAQR